MLTNNGEPKPNPYGTDTHDERFEGSTQLYAQHLVKDHGFSATAVEKLGQRGDQSAWSELNTLHRHARNLDV